MRPKFTVSTAWAEKVGFSDEDFCQTFDIDLESAEASDGRCPKCKKSSEDSNFNFYVWHPSDSPVKAEGIQYVRCLCGTMYYFGWKTETLWAPQ